MSTLDSIKEHTANAEEALLKMNWVTESDLMYPELYMGTSKAKCELKDAKEYYNKFLHSKAPKGQKEYWGMRLRELDQAIKATRVMYTLGWSPGFSYSSSDEVILWTGAGFAWFGREDSPIDHAELLYYPSYKEARARSKDMTDYVRRRLETGNRVKVVPHVYEVLIVSEPYHSALRERWITRKLAQGYARSR